ncbi:MAG TPA: IS200/IS605 family transposase [Pirellulales bacterium]|nr:IS200/IS605 family transposase [Pirellulales bacterium]
MGHVFHQLYYHFVWATHARDPHIHPSFRTQFLAILNAEAKNRGGMPIRHNAMFDHVHLLARLPPTVVVSEFIGQVKGATSFRVNHEVWPKFKLQWQEGYGVLTLREDELEKVSRYIDNQEEHHRTGRVSRILERTEEDPAAESP